MSSLVRPFVFGGRAVIKDNQRVGSFKNKTHYFQPKFHFVLLAYDDIRPRISLSKIEEGLVVSEGWADEHDVIEFAPKRATELVHEEPSFA